MEPVLISCRLDFMNAYISSRSKKSALISCRLVFMSPCFHVFRYGLLWFLWSLFGCASVFIFSPCVYDILIDMNVVMDFWSGMRCDKMSGTSVSGTK